MPTERNIIDVPFEPIGLGMRKNSNGKILKT
jgi:hypothetical protein